MHRAQERGNADPEDRIRPVPLVVATITVLMVAFGVLYILMSDPFGNSALGNRRTLADLAGPAPGATADVVLQPLPQWLAAPGTATVVDFIYTRCQKVCLSLGSTFQQLQAELLQERQSLAGPEASATVRLLSLSFDSAHDTPAMLQAYALQLQTDPSVWQFLRVPGPAELAQLLRRFEVVVLPDGRGDFEHNAALLVVGPEGRLVRVFDIAERELALNCARHLARSAVAPASGAASVANASTAAPVSASVAALTALPVNGLP